MINTLGRNDLCHCGSGKKYKKCCGVQDSSKMFIEAQNKALQGLLQEFFENHPRPSEQRDLLKWKDTVENLLVPLYGEDKSNGIIGDIFFFSERVDVWNAFIEQKIAKEERIQIKQILETWLNPMFMAGEVVSVTNYRAQVRDLLSEAVMEIEVNESFPVEAGNIATGFYLPDVRIGAHFLMVLNSLTVAVEVEQDSISKLQNMYRSSEAATAQEFYSHNILTVYQLLSSGLIATDKVSSAVLETVQELENFLIAHDLKSDELIEAFFHYAEPLALIPKEAVAGAIQFAIENRLIKLEWRTDDTAKYFAVDEDKLEGFKKEIESFYLNAMSNEDTEKEAAYAFEVGTDPKGNELQNWQLYMHLKNATIQSENELKRQMEYYHSKSYEPKTKFESAQLLAYNAYTNSNTASRLKEIQQLDPKNTDAFLLAAEMETDLAIKEQLLQQAVACGKERYEPEMDVAWLYVPNRPYLRALFLLGNFYWEQARFEEAFPVYYEVLRLNPGDHQGVRYLTVSALIALGRFEEAESLILHYEQELSDNAFFGWFKWSIEQQKSMLSQKSQDLYTEAIDQNPYVKKYIEKQSGALPYPKSAAITPRSPEEAALIWTFLAPTLKGSKHNIFQT
ncbi:tetratricopeptide (TPR) repeat protein [Planomicrobium stackebrandtii]|uniref:Tetratricopeptide (TPR) repeat protein n=1 Tax=Planomicrobium stackebrandtii TaxID=253160 RepID=A0ABU0GPC6_9BACL|nr:SEC-C metal-binding domain-containing protein [Planomicrobium stackebrandtii]MDQ0427218.1 tetratricopeptide (TPR) repeat protein [Planomicrobium stackebrandtii]